MAINPFNAYFPGIPGQFVDAERNLTTEARYFLLALYRRTGDAAGISSNAQNDQIVSLSVMEAMDFDVPPSPSQSIPTTIFDGDTAPPSLNPILAALMVADST